MFRYVSAGEAESAGHYMKRLPGPGHGPERGLSRREAAGGQIGDVESRPAALALRRRKEGNQSGATSRWSYRHSRYPREDWSPDGRRHRGALYVSYVATISLVARSHPHVCGSRPAGRLPAYMGAAAMPN